MVNGTIKWMALAQKIGRKPMYFINSLGWQNLKAGGGLIEGLFCFALVLHLYYWGYGNMSNRILEGPLKTTPLHL